MKRFGRLLFPAARPARLAWLILVSALAIAGAVGTAADWSIVQAAPLPMSGQAAPLPPGQLHEVEQRLAALGYWTGPVDGVFDAGSRHALIAFQKVAGRQRTGKPTMAELQALRAASRPLPRESDAAHIEIDLNRQVLFMIDETGIVARILPVSSGSGDFFTEGGRTRQACTPVGRFVVERKIKGWRTSPLGRLYYPNYIYLGVAIHGSPSVPATPASHGCIRIPMFAAREFSELTPVGTVVLIYDEEAPPDEKGPQP